MAEGGAQSGGLSDLDASLLSRPSGNRHHPLPFPYLIDGPRSRVPLIKSIRVFSARGQVDGFGKASIEDLVQQTVGRDAAALERHMREEFEDFIRALKGDLFHWHNVQYCSIG
jgi:hypothetical protein